MFIIAVLDEKYEVTTSDTSVVRGNTAVLRYDIDSITDQFVEDVPGCRCSIPSLVKSFVEVRSWIHEGGTRGEIFPQLGSGGKYTILPSGSLLVHHTSSYDGYKEYSCQTINRLNKQVATTTTPARLTITGQ